MKRLSTYHLVYELLSDGNGQLYPDLEPMELQEIMKEIGSRHNVSFSDISEYANWFIESSEFSDTEKSSVATMLRIIKIEGKALDNLNE
jgi:hypothetical protein